MSDLDQIVRDLKRRRRRERAIHTVTIFAMLLAYFLGVAYITQGWLW